MAEAFDMEYGNPVYLPELPESEPELQPSKDYTSILCINEKDND